MLVLAKEGKSLTHLPRTVSFEHSDGSSGVIPQGFPILTLIDQTKLPYELAYIHITDWREVISAIKELKVRGAPAIGIAGAAAVALRAAEYVFASTDEERIDAYDFERVFVIDEQGFDPQLYEMGMSYAAKMIAEARPTAVNLEHDVTVAMDIVHKDLAQGASPAIIEGHLFDTVQLMLCNDEKANRKIGRIGAELLPDGCSVLTHCNAGSLATSFFGTALGVIYTAYQDGCLKRVYADETRPICQGSRLTVWELAQAGVPVTLICDNMAASVMQRGLIDAVIVGADRIAANGDVANKIGTLGVATLARSFDIPFYVAAPLSTIDPCMSSGVNIPIEQRDPTEVLSQPIDGVDVLNPAFDVTPASLITKIITEVGAFDPQNILAALPQDVLVKDSSNSN